MAPGTLNTGAAPTLRHPGRKRCVPGLQVLLALLLAAATVAPAGAGPAPGSTQDLTNWSIQFFGGRGSPAFTPPGGNDSSSTLLLLLLTPSSTSSTTTSTSTLLLLAAAADSNQPLRGSSALVDFKAEYLPGMAGFQFGISTNTAIFRQENDTQTLATLLLLSSGSASSSTSSLNNLLLLSALADGGTEVTGYSVSTFDFAFSLHLRRGATLDPYWLIGVGVGTCGPHCSAGKAFTALGLRVNIASAFLFLEAGHQVSVLKEDGGLESGQIPENSGRIGFGLYL